MDPHPEPQYPDLARLLPSHIYCQTIYTLRATLEPIPGAPQDRVRSGDTAIALVASLSPANADEANLAVSYAAAHAHGLDCVRLSRELAATDHRFALKCTAQAASMMRQARAARSLLLRAQADRRMREMDGTVGDRPARAARHRADGADADRPCRIAGRDDAGRAAASRYRRRG